MCQTSVNLWWSETVQQTLSCALEKFHRSTAFQVCCSASQITVCVVKHSSSKWETHQMYNYKQSMGCWFKPHKKQVIIIKEKKGDDGLFLLYPFYKWITLCVNHNSKFLWPLSYYCKFYSILTYWQNLLASQFGPPDLSCATLNYSVLIIINQNSSYGLVP